MIRREGLSEEDYQKYKFPAFPILSKAPEMWGVHRHTAEISLMVFMVMFQIFKQPIFGLISGLSVAILLEYFLRKDPQYLEIAPKIRHVKKYHSPFYRYMAPTSGKTSVRRIVIKP